MKEDQKMKISQSLKSKWASGTRKPNPKGYGKKISEKLKIAHREGRMHVITADAGMKGTASRDMEKQKKLAYDLSQKNIGKEMTGRGAKSPDHHKSRLWIVENKAMGVVLRGYNLNHLVRENSRYFDQDDLNWKKYKCKASRGLRNLFVIKKSTGNPASLSWKGWTAVDVI